MSAWLLSVLGVIFLAVLLDILYPSGKTNAFCKSIFGLFAIVIMISPILKLKNIDNINTNFVDTNINESLKKSKEEYLKLKIENQLKNANINGAIVEIKGKMKNNVFEIENIFVDTSELVLTNNLTHKNKYEVIIQEILSVIEIEVERIVIYG